MNPIRYYGRLYQSFFNSCLAEALSFRINFLLLFFVDIAFYASTVGSVIFIFDHVDTIGPWNEDQFLFFLWFTLAINQLHMSLFAMSFWYFAADLRMGKLDFWLLKPAHTLFTIFFRHIRIASLLLFPIPWTGIIYYGNKLGLSWHEWLLIPPFVLMGLTLLVSIEILFAAVMFITVESIGINMLRMQIHSIARWPDFIYRYVFQKFFTVIIPALLISSAPAHTLLQTGSLSLMFMMVASILILWYLISVAWKWGFARYESASS